jgi:hypothetical protein
MQMQPDSVISPNRETYRFLKSLREDSFLRMSIRTQTEQRGRHSSIRNPKRRWPISSQMKSSNIGTPMCTTSYLVLLIFCLTGHVDEPSPSCRLPEMQVRSLPILHRAWNQIPIDRLNKKFKAFLHLHVCRPEKTRNEKCSTVWMSSYRH